MTPLEFLEWAVPAAGTSGSASELRPRRSIRRLLLPLFDHVTKTPSLWRAESAGFWPFEDGRYWMPRLVFQRKEDSDPRFKIAIFAGVHGDEPAGVHALCDFVRALDQRPEVARHFAIHIYPLCNPTGYEDGTRESRSGKDLNREFWRGSMEPEIQILERELLDHHYDGLISLHSDDTSKGLYGFVRGATLTEHLLKPALKAAAETLPINHDDTIDGFHAVEGIIHSAYDGILTTPPGTSPAPFEIILETPTEAPLMHQRAAFTLALVEIVRHYRRLMAFAADL